MQNRFFIILFFLLIAGFVQSQDKTYELNAEDHTLEDLFKKLEQEYGLLFSYKSEDIQNIALNLKTQTTDLDLLMREILKETNLGYEIVDGNYVIISSERDTDSSDVKKASVTICGEVLDQLTGEALSYANVVVEGTNIGTSTEEDGKFRLYLQPLDDQQISISYVGYETQLIDLQTFLSTGCPTISLTYPQALEPFLVIKDYITDGVKLDENGASTELNPEVIGSLPGQAEPDVLGIVQFFPGISSPSSKASDIYIRGCTPDQNLLIWEDIPIYHSAHYFGMISAFNPFIVENMKLYRGGFGAEYGGRIAGVIDLKSGDEKSDDTYFGVGSNMTHAYAYGQQKLSSEKPTSVTFSLRRSFSELLRTPTYENITKINQQGLLLGNTEVAVLPDHIKIKDDFDFLDTHVKLSTQLSTRDRVEIAALYAKNDFNGEIKDNRREETQLDTMNLENRGLSLKWEHAWSEKVYSKFKAITTSYDYMYHYRLKRDNKQQSKIAGVKDNMILDRQIQLSTVYQTDKNQEIGIGYHLTNYDIKFDIVEDAANKKDINDKGASSSLLHSFYLSYKNPIQNKVGLNLGLRTNYFEADKELYFEPRLRLSYNVSEVLSLHGNYGRHHQYVSQITVFRGNDNGINTPLWALADDNDLPVQRADIYQVGAVYKKSSWVVDLQLYSRQVDGLSSKAYDFEEFEDEIDPNKAVIGSADIQGVDILIKKRFRNIRSWISYSLSKADLTFPELMNSTFSSDYDQRHSFQWSNQLNINRFEFALGLKFSSGLPYSLMKGFKVIKGDMGPDRYEGKYDDINNYYLPNLYEVNFSAQYNLRPRHADWQGHVCFSLTNAFDKENIFNRYYIVDDPNNDPPRIELIEKTNLRLTPNVSVRIEW